MDDTFWLKLLITLAPLAALLLLRYGVRKGRADTLDRLHYASICDDVIRHAGREFRVLRRIDADSWQRTFLAVAEVEEKAEAVAAENARLLTAYHNQQTELDVARSALLAADDRAAKLAADLAKSGEAENEWAKEYKLLEEACDQMLEEKKAAEADANEATTAYIKTIDRLRAIGSYVSAEVLLATSFTNHPSGRVEADAPIIVEAGVPFLAPGWPDDADTEGGDHD